MISEVQSSLVDRLAGIGRFIGHKVEVLQGIGQNLQALQDALAVEGSIQATGTNLLTRSDDLVNNLCMKKLLISEFKAKCIAVLREAQRTGEPVLITRRGRPIARIEPIVEGSPKRRLGALRGRMRIRGDIVQVDTSEDWEVPE